MIKQAQKEHNENNGIEDSEIDLRDHQVSSPELCSVSGVTVDGGTDGEVCRFTGGLAGHAGVWTSGEAAGREGCRKGRDDQSGTASGD